MFHNLKNTTTINFSNILIMQMLVESRIEYGVLLIPLYLILLISIGVCKNLTSKRTLIFKVSLLHLLLMFLKILIFNFVLIVSVLDVNVTTSLTEILCVLNVRFVVLRQYSGFAEMVEKSATMQHHSIALKFI
jgi:hypothetical protein